MPDNREIVAVWEAWQKRAWWVAPLGGSNAHAVESSSVVCRAIE
jgi:hypothetical protein